ncbi:hypothetical protein [Brochothrix thermosphacta]|nr:hypothetical protein [Brochothrix thermosphacta]
MTDEEVVNFSNELFIFSEKLKNKMMFKQYDFSDYDWYAFKDISDKFEVE